MKILKNVSLRIPYKNLELPALYFLLLFESGAWYHHIQPIAYELNDNLILPPDPLRRLVTMLAYTSIFLLFLFKWKKVISIILKDKLLVLLIGLVCLSVLWSASPTSTLDNIKALMRSTLLGIYLVSLFSLESILTLLKKIALLSAVLSIIYFLLYPNDAVMAGLQIDQGLRGIFFHKNRLADMMSIGILACIYSSPDRQTEKLYPSEEFKENKNSPSSQKLRKAIPILILSTVLIMSNGRTPQIAILLALTVPMLLREALGFRYRLRTFILVSSTLFLFFTVIFIYSYLPEILISFGKDPTFTGRTDVWPMALERIFSRFFLGYGYQAYWPAYGNDFKAEFTLNNPMSAWTPGHAHSGFLELMLGLGMIGFTLFLVHLLKSLFRSLVLFQSEFKWTWNLQLLIFFVIQNLTAGIIPAPGIVWITYVISTSSLAYKTIKKEDKLAFNTLENQELYS